LFYTYFTNKIIPDYVINPNEIRFDNIDGYAISKGITLNTECAFTNGLKMNLGFTIMDVYSKEKNANGELVKQQQLLTENFNGTYGISYTIRPIGLTIDYTGNLYSPMKLPIQTNDFRPEYSPWWSIQNIQFTKKMYKEKLECYFGLKNLLNFLPISSIIMRPQDPFDKNVNDPINNPNGYTFDTSYMYAPYQGIRGFVGLRLTLN
jgi:outer membrane receptor for ferrienterochelin and colicins